MKIMKRRSDKSEKVDETEERESGSDIQSVMKRTDKLLEESKRNRKQIENTLQRLNNTLAF